MEAVVEVLTTIGEFITSIFEFLSNILKYIGQVITLPAKAIEVITSFSSFIPPIIWAPLLSILGIVVVFRLLKIFQSGG